MSHSVAIEQLAFSIAGKSILNISSWELPQGEHALILGESGSGKTSLLNLLGGMRHPSAGSVCIRGEDLFELEKSQGVAALDKFRGCHIGVVFQSLHLIGALTVAQNLLLAQSLAGREQSMQRIESVLASLGLQDKAQSLPSQLSGGQAQRVAIARAVINEPCMILADEPTSALDDTNTQKVVDLLKGQAESCGASLVIATHDKRLMEQFDTRLCLVNGEIAS